MHILDSKHICDAESKKHMPDLMTFCKKIEPFVNYYKKLILTYNDTAHNILERKINLILPQVLPKQKRGIIITLVSSFTGPAYEGISSFPYHKRDNALHKAVEAMNTTINVHM